jgi:hypothetical protein
MYVCIKDGAGTLGVSRPLEEKGPFLKVSFHFLLALSNFGAFKLGPLFGLSKRTRNNASAYVKIFRGIK